MAEIGMGRNNIRSGGDGRGWRPGGFFWLVLALVGANAVLLAVDFWPVRYASAVLLLCILPGFALLELIPLAAETDLIERIVLGCGASYALSLVGALLLHYLPGRLTSVSLLIVCDALILAPLALALWMGKSQHRLGSRISRLKARSMVESVISVTKIRVSVLLVVIVLASFFRFASLGYSEFQGDEALVMLRAAQVIEGWDDALFAHGKGPAEILLPAACWLLTGRIDEAGARFPFALAGLLAVGVVYLLGGRMFSLRVGWLAASLAAINGYFVGFARIVQYQSLVFLMMGLALYCYYRFYAEGAGRYQVPGALFAACGLLAHYDAALVLPAILYLAWKSRKKWKGEGVELRGYVLALAIFLVLSGLFYLPFWLDPQATTTYRYLVGRRLGSGLLHNNLGFTFLQSTVYNSTYYFVFIILALAWAVVKRLRAGRASFFSVEWMTCLIWFGVPFLLYTFLVAHPLTHVYTFFPAWMLMAGLGLDDMWQRLRVCSDDFSRPTAKTTIEIVTTGVFILLYLVFAGYIYLAFIQCEPQYIWTYPAHRSSLYWTAYRHLPPAAFFGFPYRAGWKAIGQLYAEGVLRGDYNSNEEGEITAWYARGAIRSYCPDAEYYIMADRVRDERLGVSLPEGYAPMGVVTVNGEPELRLYRHPPAEASSITCEAREAESAFDRGTTPEAVARRPTPAHPLTADLGHRIRLRGYDLESEKAQPGGSLVLTLYWEALTTMKKDYSVFIHLEDERNNERIWGQRDGLPLCGFYRTSDWRPGHPVIERYRVPVGADTPPGRHPLLAGLYQPESGQRLEVFDQAGNPQGNSVFLQEVTIIE